MLDFLPPQIGGYINLDNDTFNWLDHGFGNSLPLFARTNF